jgi:hypothetical protein
VTWLDFASKCNRLQFISIEWVFFPAVQRHAHQKTIHGMAGMSFAIGLLLTESTNKKLTFLVHTKEIP